jgi:hypothetical protein
LEVVTTVLALSIGRPGGPWGRGLVFIGPIEGNGRGVLMQSGRWDGIDLQRLERESSKHPVEMRRQQRSEDVPSPGIIERGPRSPRLKPFHHPALFQPFSHLVEGMISIENREHERFDPTPPREHMHRVGRDKTVDHGGTSRRRSTPRIQGQCATG